MWTKPGNVRIIGNGYYLQNLSFDIDKTSTLTLQIEHGAKVANGHFFIRGKNANIILGNKVKIKKGILWIEGDNCILNIGANTTVEDANFYITEPQSAINLGKSCMLARDIEFRTGDSHSIIDITSSKRINHAQSITLGDRVWVGSHAKILKGTITGNDVIIGLGSIVGGKRKLENNSIYAGIPARRVKSNVAWKRERIN